MILPETADQDLGFAMIFDARPRGLFPCILAVSWASQALAVPNFLVFAVDNVGIDKLAAYGEDPSPVSTPVIDGLAEGGVVFRYVWGNPSGSATRAAILSGQFGFHNGVGADVQDPAVDPGLEPSPSTLPGLLSSYAYSTAAFGRWDLAGCQSVEGACVGAPSDPARHPVESGFEYYSGAIRMDGSPFDHCHWERTISERLGVQISTSTESVDGHALDVTAQDAAAYLSTAQEPFFAWVALEAPTDPLHSVVSPQAPCETSTAGDPAALYDGMLERLDSAIGAVIDALPAAVRDDTTIVVVGTSGTPASVVEAPSVSEHGGGTAYEGGLRVPLIVSGPITWSPGESPALVSVVDLAATLLGLMAPSVDFSDVLPDSRDQILALLNPLGGTGRPWLIADHFERSGGASFVIRDQMIRDDRYKLIHRAESNPGAELYDLVADPLEANNLLEDPLGLGNEARAARETLHLTLSDATGICFVPDDEDMDCVAAAFDTCLGVKNGPAQGAAYQCDTDGDGYGNICDGDISNGSGSSSAEVFFQAYGSTSGQDSAYNPDADLNCDGSVTLGDYDLLVAAEAWGAPGPSGLGCAGQAGCVAPARENFLIVIGDDMGVAEIGAYAAGECVEGVCPSPPPTPTIDGIASEGVLFRNVWANPLCSSTRISMLSGRYAFRTGVGSFIHNPATSLGLDATQPNIASVLRAEGYETAAFGKWHMAGCDLVDGECVGATDFPSHPIRAGFDYFAGSRGNFNTQPDQDYCDWEKTISWRTGPGANGYASQGSRSTTYATTDTANEVIARTKIMREPWLVWLAFHAAHVPFHLPPNDPTDCTVGVEPDRRSAFIAMTERMDAELGRTLDSIRANSDVLDRTTLIFLGDNGPSSKVVQPPLTAAHAKGTPYEGGVNVPFIVSGPRVPPERQGSEVAAQVGVTDVFATLVEIAGTDPCPPGAGCAEDSVSWLPHLANPAAIPARTTVYAENFTPNQFAKRNRWYRAIRDDRYKLVVKYDRSVGSFEFFDLDQDRGEQNDLVASGLSGGAMSAYSQLSAEMMAISGGCLSIDDLDSDCVVDAADNCPSVPNGPQEAELCRGDQIDSDADGEGDACDLDVASQSFTERSRFDCASAAVAQEIDFESLSAGQVISGQRLAGSAPAQGAIGLEIVLPAGVEDVLDTSGPALELLVVDDAGGHPAASGAKTLGSDGVALQGRFAAGTRIDFGFSVPARTFGLSIVVRGVPGVAVEDDMLELIVPGAPKSQLRATDAIWVGSNQGTDYYAYFLGVAGADLFATASLQAAPTTPAGAFSFTVDDLVMAPEPGASWGLAAGLVALVVLDRLRRRRDA